MCVQIFINPSTHAEVFGRFVTVSRPSGGEREEDSERGEGRGRHSVCVCVCVFLVVTNSCSVANCCQQGN